MKFQRVNSVMCVDCKLTISEPKTVYQIRKKLKALGWQRPTHTVDGFLRFSDRCGKCSTEAQDEARSCVVQQPNYSGDIKDMVSPWAIQ